MVRSIAMSITNSENTKSMKYFQSAFKQWFENSNLKLIEAGALFDLSHTYISRIVRGKASLSIAMAERIAERIGSELPEMLIEGRNLRGINPKAKTQISFNDPFKKEKEAFESILWAGGEGAVVLKEVVLKLAETKKNQKKTDP